MLKGGYILGRCRRSTILLTEGLGVVVKQPEPEPEHTIDLACQKLGIDNPDWHAANFVVTGEGLVHVDLGATRPIGDDELGPAQARARADQGRELAWSFHDADLAQRTVALHDRATGDAGHIRQLRARARQLVTG